VPEDHLYDKPNTDLFPDFADPGTGWFDWLKGKGLRTYFNDHPFPTDNGTYAGKGTAQFTLKAPCPHVVGPGWVGDTCCLLLLAACCLLLSAACFLMYVACFVQKSITALHVC
jgi:hypothetical protein